ncbi:flagellar protein FlgN [Oceanobacillus sp. CAU 1775]
MNEIINSLEKLVALHEELLLFSEQKTEIIKEGSIEKIQKLIVKERKLIRQVEQAENERREVVKAWYIANNDSVEDASVTDILEKLTDKQEKEALEQVTIKLTKAITNLKANEQLNMALINQSMQFVQVSLDLLSPSLKNLNYGDQSDLEEPGRSVFDSKA